MEGNVEQPPPIRWRKGELIGYGAFGRVYMGMNLDSGELLAVKEWQMNRISISHSHPRPCSGKKTSRKDRNNGEADNVILIDVDPDHYDNVIIIDVPESLPKKSRGSSMLKKDKKWPFKTVICIDDDESTDDNRSGIGVNDNGSFSNSATCSKKSCFASKESENAADDTSRAFNDNHNQNVRQEIKSGKYEEAPFCSSTSL